MLLRFLLLPSLLISPILADSPRVLGIGTAGIDLLIPVEDLFLKEYVDGEKGGCCRCEPDMLNQILQASAILPQIIPGGSNANTIRGLAKLGEHCAFHGIIGNDPYGEFFFHNLQQLGIVSFLQTKQDHPTFRMLCMITPDGQRTIRASGKTYFDHFVPKEYFQNMELVHFEGYQLLVSNCVESAMQHAKEAKALVSFDLSSFETVLAHKETMLHLLTHYVDIVFANEDEARAITGLSPEEACLKLQSICPVAVVTRGDKGCLVGYQGNLIASPVFPTAVVDTTGAGDLFASGFLYGILNHYSLESCAKIANRLGSAIIQIVGASLPEEKWEEIHQFIDSLNPLDEEALTFSPLLFERSPRVSTLLDLNSVKK